AGDSSTHRATATQATSCGLCGTRWSCRSRSYRGDGHLRLRGGDGLRQLVSISGQPRIKAPSWRRVTLFKDWHVALAREGVVEIHLTAEATASRHHHDGGPALVHMESSE